MVPGTMEGVTCIMTAPDRYFITSRARATWPGWYSTNVSEVSAGTATGGLARHFQAIGGQGVAGVEGGLVAAGDADHAHRLWR